MKHLLSMAVPGAEAISCHFGVGMGFHWTTLGLLYDRQGGNSAKASQASCILFAATGVKA
jgi:hypothetical protein